MSCKSMLSAIVQEAVINPSDDVPSKSFVTIHSHYTELKGVHYFNLTARRHQSIVLGECRDVEVFLGADLINGSWVC